MTDTFELLTQDGQPVTITRNDAHRLRADLGALTIVWTTDPDATPKEEVDSYQHDMEQCHLVLIRAIRMDKLMQSVRQALAVSYTLAEGSTVTTAWTELGLDHELRDIRRTEGSEARADIETARARAWALLDAQLRAHGWQRHGDVLASTVEPVSRKLLNLETGRWVRLETRTRTVPHDENTEKQVTELVWLDENDQDVDESTRGRWWAPATDFTELPIDPWAMESHIDAERRAQRRAR